MADWKKILKDTLKDTDGAFDKVIDAFDKEGLKLQDVSTGEYTSTKKYEADVAKLNDEVTKLNGTIKEMKEAPNPLVDEIAKLKETHTAELTAERNKVQGIIKEQAISQKIASLGITDELAVLGLKSLVKADDIQMDENYNITGGLDEQIEGLKGKYNSSFETPKVVSTGQSLQTSNMNGGKTRQYTSLAEIKGLSEAEVMADIDNITAQLPNLK